MATSANYSDAATLPSVGARRKAGVRKQKKISGAKKIRHKELPVFTRQMAAMLASGMPVVQTLDALGDQTANKVMKSIAAGLRVEIEGGAALSEAFRKYPDVFDDLYVSMFKAGESGGLLAETAARIAAYLEAAAGLRRKVISALMYPAIVTVVAFLLTTGMLLFIVPVFEDIYKDFGAVLPGPTQFLVNVSNTLRHHSLYVLTVVGVAAFLWSQYRKTEHGAFMWDNLKINFPILGELNRKVALSRFASMFAQLTRSGVPILQSMEIVAYAMGNRVLGKVLLDARAYVERGEPLSRALESHKSYPRMLVHMLSAGEKTGKVDDMLEKIASFYEDEVETTLAGLTSLLEPLLIVFLGVVIGGIVVCMFMPIFKMHEIVAF
jgi:type IV pilus assembly protein PilC